MSQTVCCVDIGSSKILAVAFSRQGSELKVLGYGAGPARGVERGLVTDVDRLAGALDYALQRLERETGERYQDIILNIGGRHLTCSSSQGFVKLLPPDQKVRSSHLLQVVDHSRHVGLPAGYEQIMASVREYRLDGRRQVTRPLGMTGDRLEVLTLLVNAPSQELDQLQAAVEAANRTIVDLVPSPLAAVFGLAPREMREEHALVLDFGYSTTSISVVRHGTVAFVGVAPVGSHHITKDIAALLQCSEAESERLKTQQAHVKLSDIVADEAVEVVQNEGEPARKLKRRVLCEIVESRVRETLAHVRRLVESEGFSTQGVPVALLTGGGALLGGMDAAVEQELGVQRARTTWPKLTGMHARHLGVPEATVAVGLARIALEEGVEELQPARDSAGWRERLRAVWAMLPTGSK